MNYQTTIPSNLISEPELDALLATIARATGKQVQVERVFVVSTDDVNLTTMLDSLVEMLRDAPEPRKVKGNGHKKARKTAAAEKGEPTRGPHIRSITIVSTGEKISRFELNTRLADRSITDGTELHSPKHGKMMVVLAGEDLVLQNAQGELL